MSIPFQPTVPLNRAIYNACSALCEMAGTELPDINLEAEWQIIKRGCDAIQKLQLAGVGTVTQAELDALSAALYAAINDVSVSMQSQIDELSEELHNLKLVDLSDVAIPSPADGQVITWKSSTSRWVTRNLFAGLAISAPQFISTATTGTPPLIVSSTTVVSNLNSSLLLGSTWETPGKIGSLVPNTIRAISLTVDVNAGIGIPPSPTTVLNLPASSPGASSLRIAQGVAPSAPVNGDVWATNNGVYARINGITRDLSVDYMSRIWFYA